MNSISERNTAFPDESSDSKAGNPISDELLLAIVSDFSGLEKLENPEFASQSEPTPVIRAFESLPFPELHLEIHDEPDRVELATPLIETTVSSTIERVGEGVFQVMEAPPSVRSAQILAMRAELFSILSEDLDFPEYHVRTILNRASQITEGTAESELRDLSSLLLYFVETLGVFFDKEGQWGDSKDFYLSTLVTKADRPRFHIRAVQIFSRSEKGSGTPSKMSETRAREAFERDYSRWRKRFATLLKRYGASSSANFRVDFANKPYAKTVESCLNAVFPLWEDVRSEYRKTEFQISKIRGDALAKKISRIEAQFDFSDLERQSDLDAARNGTYRPRPKSKPE